MIDSSARPFPIEGAHHMAPAWRARTTVTVALSCFGERLLSCNTKHVRRGSRLCVVIRYACCGAACGGVVCSGLVGRPLLIYTVSMCLIVDLDATGLGCPPRNFSRQTPQHAAELIAAQLTRPPSVGTHKLSDQQHAFAKHRAMRSSPAPKHDACAVVSEDTIAIAAAVSHADGESNCAARGCCPQHR
jgi:hypothetical protein